MKNFFSKLTMLLFLLFIGLGEVWAIEKLNGKIYYDNSVTNWATVYCYVGHSSWTRVYQMSDSNGDNIWETTDISNDWGDQTHIFFANSDGNCSSWSGRNSDGNKNVTTVASDLNLSAYTGTSTMIQNGVNSADTPYRPASNANGAMLFAANIEPILNGAKTMFYIGERQDWGQSVFKLYDNTDSKSLVATADKVAGNSAPKSASQQQADHLGVVLATEGTYYLGHGDEWKSNYNHAMSAGGAYIITDNAAGSDYASASSYALNKTSATITEGTAASGIAVSATPGNSVAGFSQAVSYYHKKSDASSWTQFDPANCSSLAAGTYTVAALVSDGHICVRSTNTCTLTVSAPVVADKWSIWYYKEAAPAGDTKIAEFTDNGDGTYTLNNFELTNTNRALLWFKYGATRYLPPSGPMTTQCNLSVNDGDNGRFNWSGDDEGTYTLTISKTGEQWQVQAERQCSNTPTFTMQENTTATVNVSKDIAVTSTSNCSTYAWSVTSANASNASFGTPSAASTTFTATATGDYTVQMVATSDCGKKTTKTCTITVEAAPVVSTTWYVKWANSAQSDLFSETATANVYKSPAVSLGTGDATYFWLNDGTNDKTTGSNQIVQVALNTQYTLANKGSNGLQPPTSGSYYVYVNTSTNKFWLESASAPSAPKWYLYRGGSSVGEFQQNGDVYTLEYTTESSTGDMSFKYGSNGYYTGAENITTDFRTLVQGTGAIGWTQVGLSTGTYTFTIKQEGGAWKVKAVKSAAGLEDLWIRHEWSNSNPNSQSWSNSAMTKGADNNSYSYTVENITIGASNDEFVFQTQESGDASTKKYDHDNLSMGSNCESNGNNEYKNVKFKDAFYDTYTSVTITISDVNGTPTVSATGTKAAAASGWYLCGNSFGNDYEATNKSYPFNKSYRGIANCYYREVESASGYFLVHNGTTRYKTTSAVSAKNTRYSTQSTTYESNQFSSEFTNFWAVIDGSGTTPTFWIQDPDVTYTVSCSTAGGGLVVDGDKVTDGLTFPNAGTLTSVAGLTAISLDHMTPAISIDGTTVTVTYTPEKYAISYGVNSETMGSVEATGVTDGKAAYGSSVTFTATENTNYKFVGWYANSNFEGDPVLTTNPLEVTVEGTTSRYAKFEARTYTLVDNMTGDWLTPDMTLTDGAWTLTRDVVNIGNYTIAISTDKTAIDANKLNNGNVSYSGGKNGTTDFQIAVSRKSKVVVAYTPSTNTSGSLVVTITPYYTAQVSKGANGASATVNENEESVDVLTGTLVSYAASANDGYKFDGWYSGDDMVSAENPYKFDLTGNKSLQARFVEDRSTNYTIRLSKDSWVNHALLKAEHATTTDKAYYSVELPANTTYEFLVDRVSPNAYIYKNNGYYTIENNGHWWTFPKSDGQDNCHITTAVAGTYTFAVDFSEDAVGTEKIKVQIEYPTCYKVTFGSNLSVNGGAVENNTYIAPETELVFTATNRESAGYTFNGFFKDGDKTEAVTEGTVEGYTYTVTPAANIEVHAKYTPTGYTITYNVNGGDAIAAGNYNVEAATFSLPTPTRSGYAFKGWHDNSSLTGAVISQIVLGTTGNKEYWADWKQEGWYLHYSADGANFSEVRFDDETKNVTLTDLAAAHTYTMEIMKVADGEADTYYKNNNNMVWNNCGPWNFTTGESRNGFVTTIAGDYVFTLNNNTPNITLTYPNHSVTYSPATNGSVSGETSVKPNTAYTVTATPAAGYYLKKMLGGSTDFTSNFARQSDGSYTFEATMGATNEVWTATFAPIEMTGVQMSGSSPYATKQEIAFTPQFDLAPKGTVTLCYKLYKKNAEGNYGDPEEVTFTRTGTPVGSQATIRIEALGTYKVGVTMHAGSECSGAQIGEETFTSEFVVASLYTMTYGVVGEHGSLVAKVGGSSIGASPANVTGGVDVVFTATPDAGYSVEGWYSDADCANSIGTRGENTLTINSIAADKQVYVRFWAPANVSSISVVNATKDNIVTGEVLTATPTGITAGKGDKAYCWKLTKDGSVVATTFASEAGTKGVKFTVAEAGTYTLTLTIHEAGTCSGLIETTVTKQFTVAEDEWYIVGDNGFWAYNSASSLRPDNCTNSDNIKLFFNKDKNGNFYWGPFQFKWLAETRNYQFFRLYNKGKGEQYVAQTSSNYQITTSYSTKETGIDLKKNSTDCFTFADALKNTDYYLYIKDGKMWASTVGPELEIKVRLKSVFGEKTYYSNEVVLPENGTASDILSFYAASGATVSIEKFKLGTGWIATGLSMTAPTIEESGVYTATLTAGTEADDVIPVTCSTPAKYTGLYYIRTDAAAGRWNDYKTYADNILHKSDYLASQEGGYDYYFVNWVQKNANIRFQVANEYNYRISEEFTTDAIISTETLPADANIRYMWNSTDNTFSRAYISGSTKISDRFLVLISDTKMKDLQDPAQPWNIEGLNANELNFTDNGNWIYQADVTAENNTRVKLTADYNGHTQYFLGKTGEFTDENTEEILGTTGASTYQIRLIYDFKTNRLLSAWLAGSGNPIEEEKVINADVMIVRHQQRDAAQIVFGESGKLSQLKTVYGVLQFQKDSLNNRDKDHNLLPAAQRKGAAERGIYWISFPFDVKLSEVFSFGTYGEHWVLQYYDGAARAKNGLWIDSDTYWHTVTLAERDTFVMKKYVGYIVSLNLSKMHYNSDVFQYTDVVSIYFPSATKIDAINGLLPTEGEFKVPSHVCTITRDNRNIQDSHWNIVGVPSYSNVTTTAHDTNGQVTPEEGNWSQLGLEMGNLKYLYTWDPKTNKLSVHKVGTAFTFRSMYSYMAQYTGVIDWRQVSVIQEAGGAPARTESNHEHTFLLNLNQNAKELDHTYVQFLEEDATTDYDLNLDQCKAFNTGANLYTLIANDIELGANVLPVSTAQTIVPVGVKVAAAGEYTFSMPEGTDGAEVYLLDYETGTQVNMALDEYSVNLEAGTVNDRFALRIGNAPQTPTQVDIVDDGSETGVRIIKYIDGNGNLFIKKGAHLYDAQGHIVK